LNAHGPSRKRAQALGAHASVLAHDFGLRSAIASGDAALDNLAARVGLPQAYFVAADGQVLSNSDRRMDAHLAGIVAWAAEQQSEQI